jgi:uncharacterized protein
MSTTADFADDALAGVGFLKRKAGIDPARIGLLGHSEGGLIASIAAQRSPDVAFVVMMGPMGIPGAEEAQRQFETRAAVAGQSQASIAYVLSLQKAMFEIIRTTPDNGAATRQMNAFWEEKKGDLTHVGLTASEQAAVLAGEPLLKDRMRMMPTPWERYFLSYDPAVTLRQVHCPVLAISGTLDLQAPPGPNFPAIEAALRAAQNADVTLRVMPRLNHAMQPALTGALDEYANLEQTFDPEALAVIGDWLEAHTAPVQTKPAQ